MRSNGVVPKGEKHILLQLGPNTGGSGDGAYEEAPAEEPLSWQGLIRWYPQPGWDPPPPCTTIPSLC